MFNIQLTQNRALNPKKRNFTQVYPEKRPEPLPLPRPYPRPYPMMKPVNETHKLRLKCL